MEFLRRYLMHVLPPGFHRIRYYGLFANRCRAANLERCRALLGDEISEANGGGEGEGEAEPWEEQLRRLTGVDPTQCPACKEGRLVYVELLVAQPRRPEIALLKRAVAEQDRRIAVLETALSSLTSGTEPTVSGDSENRPIQPQHREKWMVEAAWEKIRDGMSERQVRDILGSPTSTEDVGQYRTLFYRGDVPGPGFVSGNIKLSEDRVWKVNQPVS